METARAGEAVCVAFSAACLRDISQKRKFLCVFEKVVRFSVASEKVVSACVCLSHHSCIYCSCPCIWRGYDSCNHCFDNQNRCNF